MADGSRGYEHCNGCGVCTLSCPIWQQSHDAIMTFMGRARAIQCGATPDDIRDSVNSCMLCGSCEPACSMGIPTVDITLGLRSQLAGKNTDISELVSRIPVASGRRSALVPGAALRRHADLLSRTAYLLDIPIAEDDGTDVLDSFENGIIAGDKRLNAFLMSLVGVSRVIAADGLMKRLLRAVLPHIEVIGLGEALLRLPGTRSALRGTDLYIIESRAYNADFHRCAPFYTEVSRQTGCAMNLDLQRIAIPTGTCRRADTECKWMPGITGQTNWILEGLNFNRIVVESVEDIELLRETSGVPVVHVAELPEVAAA